MTGFKIVTLLLIVFLYNSANQMTFAKNNINRQAPFLKQLMMHSLKHYDIQNIKVENDSGFQRVFSINDGYQERVLKR